MRLSRLGEWRCGRGGVFEGGRVCEDIARRFVCRECVGGRVSGRTGYKIIYPIGSSDTNISYSKSIMAPVPPQFKMKFGLTIKSHLHQPDNLATG